MEQKGANATIDRFRSSKLKIGLGMQPKQKSKPYRVKPFESGYVSVVKQRSMNQLADELESVAGGIR